MTPAEQLLALAQSWQDALAVALWLAVFSLGLVSVSVLK